VIIIHPKKSTFKAIWDFIYSILLGMSLFMIPFTLAFDVDLILDSNRVLEFVIDIVCALNIVLTFFTAYQEDISWKTKLKDIAKAYVKFYFIFDVTATIPTMVTFEKNSLYILKVFRIIHFRQFVRIFNENLNRIFNRIGLNKNVIGRIFFLVTISFNLTFIIHILACIWVYIGRTTTGSWIDAGPPDPNTDDNIIPEPFTMSNKTNIFIVSVYWVITTLTTVGYGDYKGYTNNEYVFQMAVEFIGIGFFSFLMGSINNILVQESKL